MYVEHPELATMESIMTNVGACHYFKLYLASKLQLENYNFWSEVEKFKSQFLYSAERISAHYIDEGAISQVNIDAKMRKVRLFVMVTQSILAMSIDDCICWLTLVLF
jgi:hypothetical protein